MASRCPRPGYGRVVGALAVDMVISGIFVLVAAELTKPVAAISTEIERAAAERRMKIGILVGGLIALPVSALAARAIIRS